MNPALITVIALGVVLVVAWDGVLPAGSHPR